MTRLPQLVGACLLVAAVAGVGALASPGATLESPPDTATAIAAADAPTATSADARAATAAADERAATTSNHAPTTAAGERTLVVEDAETGERLLAVPVAEGTTVALNYTHSVEKTPVLDVYAVAGTELEMVRMEFHSYGAGLPARADVTITENDTFVFDPEGSYEQLYVTPGRVAGHELVVGDRTYDLVERADARTVKIHVAEGSPPTAPRTP